MDVAPCLHVIAHMDLDMSPCLHIITHMDMDMTPSIWIWLHVHIFVTLNLLSLTSRHGSGYGSMFAYYCSHGAILHSVNNRHLYMAPCLHIFTDMDMDMTPLSM